MTKFTVPGVRAATAGMSVLAVVLLAACSGGDSEPKKEPSADVPDGTIAFRRFLDAEQTKGALFTMSTDGKGERQVTRPEDTIDTFPDWSPDGKQLVFHREFPDKPIEVFVVNADGSDERRVSPGNPPTGPKAEINEQAEPAWSPDGKRLAFTWAFPKEKQLRGEPWIEVSGISTMNVDGSDATLVTQRKPRPTTSEDLAATWSPDGRQIAFVRSNSTDEPLDASAIFVADAADGSDARRVTPWKLQAGDPAWSPDGKLISFRSQPTEEEFVGDIHTVHPDGSALTRLTKADGNQVFASSFSPDSQWIVFAMTGVDALPDLYVMRQDGSDVTPLTRTSDWESAPDWSPSP